MELWAKRITKFNLANQNSGVYVLPKFIIRGHFRALSYKKFIPERIFEKGIEQGCPVKVEFRRLDSEAASGNKGFRGSDLEGSLAEKRAKPFLDSN